MYGSKIGFRIFLVINLKMQANNGGVEMELMSPELYYEYHAKEYAERFRIYSDAAVRDIKRQIGNEPDIQVTIEEEERGKGLFSVSMSISGLGEALFVRKVGKNVIHLIKKVKKLLLNKVRSHQHRKINRRQLREQKELMAS